MASSSTLIAPNFFARLSDCLVGRVGRFHSSICLWVTAILSKWISRRRHVGGVLFQLPAPRLDRLGQSPQSGKRSKASQPAPCIRRRRAERTLTRSRERPLAAHRISL